MVNENMSSKPKASKSQTKLGPIKTPLVKTPPKIEEQITDAEKERTDRIRGAKGLPPIYGKSYRKDGK